MDIKPIIPSTDIRKFSLIIGKEQIEVVTKPGIPEWDLVSPSVQLLAEYARIDPTDTVLLYGHHLGTLGVYLSRNLPKCQLSITDDNYSEIEMTKLTLEANHIFSVNILAYIDLPDDLSQKFNAVFIQLPKGRQLARRWLFQAYNALVEGGNLYLSGPNHYGIQSAVKDAQELFASGQILAYKKGHRIAHFIKRIGDLPQPDWVQAPGIAPHTWVEFSIRLSNHTFRIRSLPGIFSFDHLDTGTEMLLNVIRTTPGAHVLDIGCGYGVIGMHAAKQGAAMVDLVDNNLLAVAACRETIALNCITNAEVYAGDLLFPVALSNYDLILSNPPFHTGQAVDYHIAQAMISQSYSALNPGGQMIIVANRFIRYDHLIQDIFGNNSILVKSGRFHVLSGLKSS